MRNPLLVGERLYLRPLEVADADGLARRVTEETETLMEHGRIPVSPLGFEHWIKAVHARQPPNDVYFAVCLTEDDRFIGIVDVKDIDWINRTGETGSGLGPAEFRGQGYGTEAKHLLLEYCFDHLHLHTVWAHVWEPNARSAAALAKQGYRPAGRLKWEDVKDGVYRDALLFDLLRDDWLAARAAWRASRT